MEQTERKARLEFVRFHNPSNGYFVGQFHDLELKAGFVATGHLDNPAEDQVYKLTGHDTVHPKYGRQFAIESIEKELPNQSDAVVRFLSGPKFPGIGKKTAQLIVDTLGEDCLDQIKEDEDVLKQVAGLKPDKADIIRSSILEFAGSSQDYTRLLSIGIPDRQANLLLEQYDDVFSVLEDNPFRPLYEVYGFGYKSALKLADALEVPPEDESRTDARIYELARNLSMKSGDTYVTFYELFENLHDLVPEEFEASLDRLQEAGALRVEEQNVYPFTLYDDEKTIAKELAIRVGDTEFEDLEELEARIKAIEFAEAITYDEVQKEAIRAFFQSDFSIMNGGPGTGKTTTVKGILKLCHSLFPDLKVQLCAPTGRAAKRLAQLSDNDAKTIHSLLRWDKDTNTFAKNERDNLDCDILIVDEFSMVDTWLFASLLKALPRSCKVLLIGDENQLESVGPGKVFADLIESKACPVTRLQRIFRQKEGSGIITLAQEIREETPCSFTDGVAFEDLPPDQIRTRIETWTKDLKAGGEDVSPFASLQVMAPMYKGPAGIDLINETMQALLNPQDGTKEELKAGSVTFRENDKVMLLKNRPDDDVFNGDIGWICEIDRTNQVVAVDFGHTIVDFAQDFLYYLSHAWCVSVHKAQGSEYDRAVVIASCSYPGMMNQKLLYTAISRAKKDLLILGNRDQFEKRVRAKAVRSRRTTLQKRIDAYLK